MATFFGYVLPLKNFENVIINLNKLFLYFSFFFFDDIL